MTIQASYKLNSEEILASSSIILVGKDLFSMSFSEGRDGLTVEIQFLQRDMPGNPNTQIETRPNNTLRIQLINWHNSEIEKERLATLNGRPVYFSFASTPLGTNQILQYTITAGTI
jgi:hypothetical protein